MAELLTMPKFGQTMEEGTIVTWRKQVGQAIAKGEVYLEIETDKALMEVESEVEGTLLRILVSEGETLQCGTPIGWVGREGEPIPDLA